MKFWSQIKINFDLHLTSSYQHQWEIISNFMIDTPISLIQIQAFNKGTSLRVFRIDSILDRYDQTLRAEDASKSSLIYLLQTKKYYRNSSET